MNKIIRFNSTKLPKSVLKHSKNYLLCFTGIRSFFNFFLPSISDRNNNSAMKWSYRLLRTLVGFETWSCVPLVTAIANDPLRHSVAENMGSIEIYNQKVLIATKRKKMRQASVSSAPSNLGSQQGCQSFIGTWYQNRKNVPNGHKISQTSIKYSKWSLNIHININILNKYKHFSI
jgi:hypothetical protein